jgi:hypothetical protein
LLIVASIMNLRNVVMRKDGQERDDDEEGGHERGDGGEDFPELIEDAQDLEIGAAETNNEVCCCFVLKSMASLMRPQI